jgi:hypothetical protein
LAKQLTPLPLARRTELSLGPQDVIPQSIADQLDALNKQKLPHEAYKRELQNIFGWKEDPAWQNNEAMNHYLMGFIDGEGSLHASLKKSKGSVSGVSLDLGFSITQTTDQSKPLFMALCIFGVGTIRLKPGSRATLLYEVGDRKEIYNHVLPFLAAYLPLYSPQSHMERYNCFLKLLKLYMDGGMSDKNTLLNDILPLWHSLRKQIGQKNESFKDLADAKSHVEAKFRPDKRKQKR